MLSRVVARLGLLALIASAGLVVSSVSASATCTVPNTLTNGQATDATQVMANFNSLLTCINSAASAAPVTPQGRLTLTSNTPVMTADATAQAIIYYTPYIGNQITIAGTTYTFSQVSYSLSSSAHLSTKPYDIFAYVASGSVALCTGPAWSSGTTRAAAINMPSGIWSNQASLTCTVSGGGSTTTIPANGATYLGPFYATANGQTGMAFKPPASSGGTNNILGLWNAYNRVTVSAFNMDSTASWTYNSATWRAFNGSNSNRVTFVDGLQQSAVEANIRTTFWTIGATYFSMSVSVDSTSAPPTAWSLSGQNGAGNIVLGDTYTETFAPVGTGLHFVQAMEAELIGSGGYTVTANGRESFIVTLQM